VQYHNNYTVLIVGLLWSSTGLFN